MSALFEQRQALVTGVTSGIGRATALRLLAEGAAVIGLGRDHVKLADIASRAGGRFKPLLADLSRPEDRARAAESLRRIERPVDLFVSNAAEAVFKTPLEVSPEVARRLFEVNVCAPLELCQAVASRMGPTGHVVQISSVTARFLPTAKFGAYAMTKAAVERLVEALRLELTPRGVRVSSISPGLVDTPIYDKLDGFSETRRRLTEQVPAWLSSDDIAEAVLWILSRPANVVVSDLVVMPKGQVR
jgi:NAD(P)-dependent dehydrogenase (short-subunit alcohol dehydrogenase family)